MEEQNRSLGKGTKLCEECKSNPSIYKCPACSIRSCSLACVKAHKQTTGCTGKRNQTQFVRISQFDDNLLLSGCLFTLKAFKVLLGAGEPSSCFFSKECQKERRINLQQEEGHVLDNWMAFPSDRYCFS